MSTTLRLTNEDGTITIETHQNVDGCGEFINHLVRPILKAAGFLDSTVNDYIGDYQAVEELAPRRVSDFLHGVNRYDDCGVRRFGDTPDFEFDPDEDSFATEYVDPYDAPPKPKRKAKKK